MSFNENSIDEDWNITPLKKENENNSTLDKKPIARPKENRKFCERWLSLFSPWLTRCEDDSNRPFCRACQRPLDNNRFRLQRHERTAKHSRNQEILLNEGEDTVRSILSKNKIRKRYIKKETSINSFSLKLERTNFENETPLKKFKTPKAMSTPVESNESNSFKYAKQECSDMNDFYYSPHQYSRPPALPPLPKKDSFDLFFEAISATVKNLPPKLAAEVKSRVSQVIAEFELRAICEKEAKEKSQQSVITVPTEMTNVVTIDPVISTAPSANVITSTGNQQNVECASTVTQYVYTYQQKKEVN